MKRRRPRPVRTLVHDSNRTRSTSVCPKITLRDPQSITPGPNFHMAFNLRSSSSLCRDPLSAASFAADAPGAENSVLASSRAAAVAYYAAVDKFRTSTSPSALEEAMVAIEAAQITEKDARAKNLTQVIAIMARCDVLVEQKPEPAAWWAVVGTRVEMEGAEATLSETGGWGDERRARYADLLQAAQIKVDEGLLIDNPWLNMLWAEIVALLVDDDGADTMCDDMEWE